MSDPSFLHKLKLLCLALTSFGSIEPVLGYFEVSSLKVREMNGISFDAVSGFQKTWKLVTVRFREDSKELRFTYANDLAFRAMSKLSPEYPDGAMFGKITYKTEMDPSFTSSVLPGSVQRYQIMKRNKKKYASTGGWGYALFTSTGNLFSEPVPQKTQACFACHSLVDERNFVFSRPIIHEKAQAQAMPFVQRFRKDFSGSVVKLLPETEWVEALEGSLQQSAFSGTLDEIVPVLVERSESTRKPSVLFVNEKNFTLVSPQSDQCLGSGKLKKVIRIVSNGGLVREAEFCP